MVLTGAGLGWRSGGRVCVTARLFDSPSAAVLALLSEAAGRLGRGGWAVRCLVRVHVPSAARYCVGEGFSGVGWGVQLGCRFGVVLRGLRLIRTCRAMCLRLVLLRRRGL